MNDDWRLRIDLHENGLAHRLGELLGAEELEHDLERSFHDRVVVSVDGAEVFCYTGTRPQAERAASNPPSPPTIRALRGVRLAGDQRAALQRC